MKVYYIEAEWPDGIPGVISKDDWIILDTEMDALLTDEGFGGYLRPLKGTIKDEKDFWASQGIVNVTYLGEL